MFPNLDPDIPQLPPEQVRFIEVRPEPWPDGQRVKVLARITPFLQPPSLVFSILDAQRDELATASIIETDLADLAITLHLRGGGGRGSYLLHAVLFYDEDHPVDERDEPFEISA